MKRTSHIVPAVTVGVWLLTGTPAWATSTDRGVWFFDTSHPLGSSQVVGNSLKQQTVVSHDIKFNVARSYNSYVAAPPSADLAAWHVQLNANSITPMFLLSDSEPTVDLSVIQNQVINFNSGRPANERYAGVKFDLEPHASPQWNASDPSLAAATQRRDMLNTLRDSYASVRTLLDANGLTTMPIYADLPTFFDNTDGFIAWGQGTALTPDQERDQWFSDIATSLDGITMMAFGTNNFTTIEAVVNWEINNFTKDVRIGLEVDVGSGQTWTTFQDFLNMANQVEDYYNIPANNPSGHSIGIDIQNFTQLFTASQPEPMTAVMSFMGLGAIWLSVRRRIADR